MRSSPAARQAHVVASAASAAGSPRAAPLAAVAAGGVGARPRRSNDDAPPAGPDVARQPAAAGLPELPEGFALRPAAVHADAAGGDDEDAASSSAEKDDHHDGDPLHNPPPGPSEYVLPPPDDLMPLPKGGVVRALQADPVPPAPAGRQRYKGVPRGIVGPPGQQPPPAAAAAAAGGGPRAPPPPAAWQLLLAPGAFLVLRPTALAGASRLVLHYLSQAQIDSLAEAPGLWLPMMVVMLVAFEGGGEKKRPRVLVAPCRWLSASRKPGPLRWDEVHPETDCTHGVAEAQRDRIRQANQREPPFFRIGLDGVAAVWMRPPPGPDGRPRAVHATMLKAGEAPPPLDASTLQRLWYEVGHFLKPPPKKAIKQSSESEKKPASAPPWSTHASKGSSDSGGECSSESEDEDDVVRLLTEPGAFGIADGVRSVIGLVLSTEHDVTAVELEFSLMPGAHAPSWRPRVPAGLRRAIKFAADEFTDHVKVLAGGKKYASRKVMKVSAGRTTRTTMPWAAWVKSVRTCITTGSLPVVRYSVIQAEGAEADEDGDVRGSRGTASGGSGRLAESGAARAGRPAAAGSGTRRGGDAWDVYIKELQSAFKERLEAEKRAARAEGQVEALKAGDEAAAKARKEGQEFTMNLMEYTLGLQARSLLAATDAGGRAAANAVAAAHGGRAAGADGGGGGAVGSSGGGPAERAVRPWPAEWLPGHTSRSDAVVLARLLRERLDYGGADDLRRGLQKRGKEALMKILGTMTVGEADRMDDLFDAIMTGKKAVEDAE